MTFFSKYRVGIILFLLLYSCFPKAQAQISEAICKYYPDSLRPANPRQLTFKETRRLLINASFFVDQSAQGPLDTLARSFEQSLKTDTSKAHRIIGYVVILNYYWNNGKIGTAGILAYCRLVLQEIGDDPSFEELKWETEGYILR